MPERPTDPKPPQPAAEGAKPTAKPGDAATEAGANGAPDAAETDGSADEIATPESGDESPPFRRDQVLNDFRQSLASPGRSGTRPRKPRGGNPRFR